jgi:hypothetical protein
MLVQAFTHPGEEDQIRVQLVAASAHTRSIEEMKQPASHGHGAHLTAPYTKRHLEAQLAVREAQVRTRTRPIALVSARVRHEALRVADEEGGILCPAGVAPAAAGVTEGESGPAAVSRRTIRMRTRQPFKVRKFTQPLERLTKVRLEGRR